jgi:diadenosine tetraphosphate (Ap4A) HIT family hydrolase
MNYDPDNIFAQILRGKIPCDKVYENDHALAFRDINPQAPVHVLIIPKGPYVSSTEFSANANDAEVAGFMRAVNAVVESEGVAEAGYRLIANAGADGLQDVPHFHMHLLGGRPLGRMLGPAPD